MDVQARRIFVACGVAAALAWLVLVVSAVLFARLPAEGKPLAELGWPVKGGLQTPDFVSIDEDGTEAWISMNHSVCRLLLASGRMKSCNEIGESGRAQHVVARNHLLMAFSGVEDRGAHVHVFAADGRSPVSVEVPLSKGAEVVNAGFNPERDRFELYIRPSEPTAPIEVVPIALDGTVAPIENLALKLDLENVARSFAGQTVAVIRAPPSLVFWNPSSRSASAWNGSVSNIDVDPASCGATTSSCVTASSRVAFQSIERIALIIDNAGHFVRLHQDTGEPATLISRYGPNGTEDFIASSHDEGARVTTTTMGSDRIDFWTQSRGFETVLWIRKSGGPFRSVVRDDGPWLAIPHYDGVFLMSPTWGGRGVSLDLNLERREPPSFLAKLKAIVSRRITYAPIAVLVYFAALLAFPLLALLTLRKRASAPKTATLLGYAAVVILLLLTEGGNMFPPG